MRTALTVAVCVTEFAFGVAVLIRLPSEPPERDIAHLAAWLTVCVLVAGAICTTAAAMA